MFGYAEYILHINLSNNSIRKEKVSKDLIYGYLGARGFNARILWDMVDKDVDPIGPDNVIIFGTGVASGTHSPSSGRTTVTFKSPATGLYAKSSGGGHFGPELKFAGYNNVVITGKAQKPVYIMIKDEQVEIRDASHLWGLTVPEADKKLKEEMKDIYAESVCIGPAGENLVNFASVMLSVHCAAARAGGGAVMGSKNLKAIVVRGTGSVKVADKNAFGQIVNESIQDLGNFPSRKRLSEFGTSSLVGIRNDMHLLPTNNWKKDHLDDAERISGQYIKEKGYLIKGSGCGSCATGCHRYTEVKDGKYAGTHSYGPEYETVAALGVGCGIVDTEAVLKGSQLCNDLGMDTISAGGVAQWAMECYEKGLITDKDTGGMPVLWGDGSVLVNLLEMIAHRKLIGDVLAEGVAKAARVVGGDSWKWAMHVKGLEYSRAEIRARTGYALALAVNPRGADHLHSQVYAEFGATPEARNLVKMICGDDKYCDPLMPDKRADMIRWHEDCYVVSDCMGLCTFSTLGHGYLITPDVMAAQMSSLTGYEFTGEEMMRIGRKVINLERSFNMREGASRNEDYPPWRFFNEPISSGPYKGAKLDKEMFDGMLDDYYRLHGWNLKTGIPNADTLKELDLKDVAEELKSLGVYGSEN